MMDHVAWEANANLAQSLLLLAVKSHVLSSQEHPLIALAAAIRQRHISIPSACSLVLPPIDLRASHSRLESVAMVQGMKEQRASPSPRR